MTYNRPRSLEFADKEFQEAFKAHFNIFASKSFLQLATFLGRNPYEIWLEGTFRWMLKQFSNAKLLKLLKESQSTLDRELEFRDTYISFLIDEIEDRLNDNSTAQSSK